MTPLEIRRLSTSHNAFTNITATVQAVLDAWARDDLISGHALCSVTVATAGAGVLVAESDPDGWNFRFVGQVLNTWFPLDLGGLRGTLPRASEMFLVKGNEILGGKRVYLFDSGGAGACEVAITLL